MFYQGSERVVVISKKSLSINALLNALKTLMSVIFPLITYPYITRVLGAENVGKVTFSNSVIEYFILISMLGMHVYGVREGAKKKNSPEDFTLFVSEVTTINLIMTVVSYVILFVCVFFVSKLSVYRPLLLLISLNVFFSSLSLDWLNVIYENYLLITARLLCAEAIMLAILFCFVKKPEDYFIYAVITMIPNAVMFITNVFTLKRKVKIRLTFRPDLKQHLKPLLLIFANTIAISVYVNFDITMLGWIKGDTSVGLYSIAGKIYNVVKNILIAIYTVSIARLAALYGENKKGEFKKLYSDIFALVTVILVPAGVGLAALSQEIMYIVGGEKYIPASKSLFILAIALIFAIWGGLITAVLNICIGREKDNLIATVLGALLNVGLNFFFIDRFDYIGAAITTLIAELFVLLFCLLRTKNMSQYFNFTVIGNSLLDAIVGSIFVIAFTAVVKQVISYIIIRVVLIILFSCAAYAIYLIFIRKNTFLLRMIKKYILRKPDVCDNIAK